MRNGEQGNGGLTPTAARTLEYSIIGLGVFALLMIFQPFNIALFTVGCALIVLAGLVNNLLPLAQPGVSGPYEIERVAAGATKSRRHVVVSCPLL